MRRLLRSLSSLISTISFGRFGPRDFRVIGKAIPSPDGTLLLEVMANKHYKNPAVGRVVTFDIRDLNRQFMHHVQTQTSWWNEWSLMWYDNHIILIQENDTVKFAYEVGTGSMVNVLNWPPYGGKSRTTG